MHCLRLCSLFLVIALAGCVDEGTVAPRQNSSNLLERGFYKPLPGSDSILFELSKEIPGFGGFYFDSEGNLHVNLKDPERSRAEASVRRLAPAIQAFRGPMGSRASGRLLIHKVKYGFDEVVQWKPVAYQAMAAGLAYAVDADEARSALVVYVEPGQSVVGTRLWLISRGIPADGLAVLVAPKPTPAATLRDYVRPLASGLEVFTPAYGGPGCTLGPLLRYDNQRAVLVNSHCTTNPFTATVGDVMAQTAFHQIGLEIADRRQGDQIGCWSPWTYCRASDAAIVALHDSVSDDFSKILVTLNPSPDSTGVTINTSATKTVIQTADILTSYMGQTLYKTGRTTGTTYGAVISTGNELQVAPGQVLCCNDYVQAGVNGGDSGSPVFRDLGNGNAELHGILHSRGVDASGNVYFAFSSVLGIVLDFLGAWNNNTQTYEHTFTWF